MPGLALVLVLLLAGAVRLAYGPWPIDDAYITFRYARNLAAGEGFVFNTGDPVLGTTTPGYTLLLVPAAWLGLDLARVAWAVALVADGLTGWLLWRLGRHAGGAGALAALLLLLAPKFVIWSSVSGMETSLYVLGLVATVALYWEGRRTAAAVTLGLLLWVRPDALLLGAAVALHAALTRRGWLWREGLTAAAVVLPWVLFSWWYFGSPVPASVLAKASSNDLTAAESVAALGGHFLATWYERLLLVPALVGAGATLARRRPDPGRLLLLWGGLYGAVFGAAGAFGHHLWYFVPLYVPYFWCAGTGLRVIGDVVGGVGGERFGPARRPVVALGAALGAATLVGLLLWQLHLGLDHVTAAHAAREHRYREVATALEAIAPGEPVAATEVGALGWYFPGPVVDLVGLVTPEAIGRPYVETMRTMRPRWLVTYDDLFDDPAVLDAAWFRQEWAPEASYPVSETRTLYVFSRATAPTALLESWRGPGLTYETPLTDTSPPEPHSAAP